MKGAASEQCGARMEGAMREESDGSMEDATFRRSVSSKSQSSAGGGSILQQSVSSKSESSPGGRNVNPILSEIDEKEQITPVHVDEISQLEERIRRLRQQNQNAVIYKADASQRNVEGEYLGSAVISLGLFDRISWNGFENSTKEKDSLKIDVLIAFLADLGKDPKDWPEIYERVVQIPQDLKAYYDRSFCLDLPDKAVQSSLALDSIFVTLFLLAFNQTRNNFLHLERSFKSRFRTTFDLLYWERQNFELFNDILNMENQIPLVLIEQVVALMWDAVVPVEAVEAGNVDAVAKDEAGEAEKPLFEVDKAKGADNTRKLLRSLSPHKIFQDICFRVQCNYSMQFPNFGQANRKIIISPTTVCHEESWGALQPDRHDHHLLSTFIATLWEKAFADISGSKKIGAQAKRLMRRTWERSLKASKSYHNDARYLTQMPTAEILHRRGIKFEGRNGGYFPQLTIFLPWRATLYLPTIRYIGHETQKHWRNVLLWEDIYRKRQSRKERKGKPFTQYVQFMDNLIDSERDVAVLLEGKNPVIVHAALGDNKAVAGFFNYLLKGVSVEALGDTKAVDGHKHYLHNSKGIAIEEKWEKILREINTFHNDKFGRASANFLKTYFSSQLLIVSVITAFIVLAASVLQTVYTILSYYQSDP